MTCNDWIARWHAADCAAHDAMRTVALQSRLARVQLGHAPTGAEWQRATGMREVADALLRQATLAARRGPVTLLTSPRLGYDEMWQVALRSATRTPATCAHA